MHANLQRKATALGVCGMCIMSGYIYRALPVQRTGLDWNPHFQIKCFRSHRPFACQEGQPGLRLPSDISYLFSQWVSYMLHNIRTRGVPEIKQKKLLFSWRYFYQSLFTNISENIKFLKTRNCLRYSLIFNVEQSLQRSWISPSTWYVQENIK